MEIRGKGLILRPWQRGDETALVQHANNRNVWCTLRDRFPHPYTRKDAEVWVQFVENQPGPPLNFAIIADGSPVGAAGLLRRDDVDQKTAEIGYWVGETYWGRGLASEATRQISEYAFSSFDFERLEAGVFAWNKGSVRVLEKAGYTLEARLARSVFKEGKVGDKLIYGRLRHGNPRL